jgi:hypothetical protein
MIGKGTPKGGKMTRKLLLIAAVCALLVFGSGSLQAAPVTPADAQPVAPYAPDDLNTTFRINVVFVGYEEADIDEPQFLNELPTTYDPLVRYPNVYYGIQLPVHIHGDYEYDITYAPSGFEDDFFEYLAMIGTAGPLTIYQEQYNEQVHATGLVEAPVLYIDAPSTELWLMKNARSQLGLDVANYTIFFINWYNRPDFVNHVYTKYDTTDPDTGYNFGIERPTRKMIAWGGSYGRTWFYDLSAGPEAWTDNWNVDDADVDGGGDLDYRMPPVWEYGNLTGYRPFDDLSGDLGKVARYVAINLLFTSSPLYDPLVSEPFPGKGKRLFVNMFEDDPGSKGTDWIKKSYILRTMRAFQKQFKWKMAIKDQPLVDPALTSFRIWAGLDNSAGCWNQYGDVFAELFCFFDANRDNYLPKIKPNKNYIGGVFAFNTTDENLGDLVGLLGYADDDWVSGTPTYVFEFDTPSTREAGFGFSTTTTHEFGHHIGMSHPHDGYDSQSGVDYDATGEFYYAWSGDESHTVMSYNALANEFGWFDRDNMKRFMIGRYLERAAEIAAQVGEATGSREAGDLISRAQADANSAREAYRAMDYELAVTHAKASFDRVYRAAQISGLNVPMTEPLPASGPPRKPKMVDPIRFPDE